jgi:RNA polymerase sigma factor (sigma-70 family)
MNTNIINRTDLVNLLFKDLNHIDVISPEEEERLFDIYRNPESTDEEKTAARDRLVMGNARLIVSLVKPFATEENFLDLFSEGAMGVMEAIDKFEPTRGLRLMSYALHYVRQRVNLYVCRVQPTVVNVNYNNIPKIRKASERFRQDHGREASEFELADLCQEMYGIKIKDPRDLMSALIVSTGASVADGDDVMDLEETDEYVQRTASENGYEETAANEETLSTVQTLLGALSEKERDIICMSFGIGYSHPYSNDDIGMKYDCCAERIRQIVAGAIKKLRTAGVSVAR